MYTAHAIEIFEAAIRYPPPTRAIEKGWIQSHEKKRGRERGRFKIYPQHVDLGSLLSPFLTCIACLDAASGTFRFDNDTTMEARVVKKKKGGSQTN
jgi:hypothetical protein